MGIDFRFNIGHATVADFNVVLVEDFVKFMLSLKVLLDEVQENSYDVGEGVVVERRVEPDDVSLSVIPHSVFWDWFVLEIVVVYRSF